VTDRAARAAADAALAELVAGSGAELLRVAYLLCGDSGRAEDLVQDALLKLLRRWRTGAAADHPRAYARKAIVNEYLGWRRRRASSEVLLVDEPEREQPDAAQRVADRDLAWRLISGLPTRSRAVLVLRYYEQLPDREIAACLDCAEATVRSIAARALATLRAHPQLAAHALQKEA